LGGSPPQPLSAARRPTHSHAIGSRRSRGLTRRSRAAARSYTTRQTFGQVWIAQAAQRSESSTRSPSKLAHLHEAVMAACDGTTA